MTTAHASAMQSLIAKATRLPEYQLLTRRRYSNPDGYLKFEEIAARVAAALQVSLGSDYQQWDWTQQVLTPIAVELAHMQPPVYWVTASLLQALMATDLPEEVAVSQLQPVIKGAFFVLPKGLLLNPDGESVDFIGVRQFKPGEPWQRIKFGRYTLELSSVTGDAVGTDNGTVLWFTQLASGYMYAGNLAVNRKEVIKGKTHLPEGYSAEVAQQEKLFTEITVAQTLLKLLICMQMRPDLTENGQFLQSGRRPGVKLGKAKQFNELWSPNWLGKSYQNASQRDYGGTHARPRMHWRRGHLRRVPVGKRELNERKWTERKWTWIEPVLVNPAEGGGA